MKELIAEINKASSLESLFRIGDKHIKELHASAELRHIFREKRKELKRIEWLHFERLQYQS